METYLTYFSKEPSLPRSRLCIVDNEFCQRTVIETEKQAKEIRDLLRPEIKTVTHLHVVERGGGSTNTGHAQIVSRLDDLPFRAHNNRISGSCNSIHANFFVKYCFLVFLRRWRWEWSGEISYCYVKDLLPKKDLFWRFEGEEREEPVFEVVKDEEWSRMPINAVKAALEKSKNYHCRGAFFAKCA